MIRVQLQGRLRNPTVILLIDQSTDVETNCTQLLLFHDSTHLKWHIQYSLYHPYACAILNWWSTIGMLFASNAINNTFEYNLNPLINKEAARGVFHMMDELVFCWHSLCYFQQTTYIIPQIEVAIGHHPSIYYTNKGTTNPLLCMAGNLPKKSRPIIVTTACIEHRTRRHTRAFLHKTSTAEGGYYLLSMG